MDISSLDSSTWISLKGRPRLLIYFIPGNPGLCVFYNVFLSCLLDQLNQRNIPAAIRCVSHLGHSLQQAIPENYHHLHRQQQQQHPRRHHHRRRYSVQDQIHHHHSYVHKHILPDLTEQDSIIFIGHSIGTYIALQLLHKESQLSTITNASPLLHRVPLLMGLFPTIEKMADSPQGKRMKKLFHPPLLWLIITLSAVYHWLFPNFIKQWILRRHLRQEQQQPKVKQPNKQKQQPTTTNSDDDDDDEMNGMMNNNDNDDQNNQDDICPPACFHEGVQQLLRPSIIGQVFHMAHTEMLEVNELNENQIILPLIEKHNIRMSLHYTQTDDWAPPEYFYNLIQRCPQIEAKLHENGPDHAFVMKHNHFVAKLCANVIHEAKIV